MVFYSSRNVALVLSLWFVPAQAFSLAQVPLYSLAPIPVKVTDALFPTAGPLIAAVSLLATVDPDGRVSETQVLDSTGSSSYGERYEGTLIGYIEDSVNAVKQWTFRPPMGIGSLKSAPSLASITFVYDWVFGPEPGFSPVLPAMRNVAPEPGDYQPPLPVRLPIKLFRPQNAVGFGTVVLLLDIESNGSVSDIIVTKSVPTLDEPLISAAKNWEFQPARYQGKSIPSRAIVAFVLAHPTPLP
jgi:TonB family protein